MPADTRVSTKSSICGCSRITLSGGRCVPQAQSQILIPNPTFRTHAGDIGKVLNGCRSSFIGVSLILYDTL